MRRKKVYFAGRESTFVKAKKSEITDAFQATGILIYFRARRMMLTECQKSENRSYVLFLRVNQSDTIKSRFQNNYSAMDVDVNLKG